MAAKQTHPCKVVLIVDDEPLLRMAAADYLTDAGFEVVEAGSAGEAMRVLDERKDISVLFSDIQMTGTIWSGRSRIGRHPGSVSTSAIR
jgi:CheY-like chemotaxis protein